ncbi:fatty acyl-AMP ligase [Nocardia sp. NPDC060259]|uniref:fatty acyl-AMP ligase n=1 Tax=Nocardia sp. NPDC060259 TaxID=3347088 RepID=UPI00365B43A9
MLRSVNGLSTLYSTIPSSGTIFLHRAPARYDERGTSHGPACFLRTRPGSDTPWETGNSAHWKVTRSPVAARSAVGIVRIVSREDGFGCCAIRIPPSRMDMGRSMTMETTLRARTLAEAISLRATEDTNRTAYTFLADGENESLSLTFGEVGVRATAIASRLAAVAAPGERALIIAPDSADFVLAFLACQYAGVIAVPVYPPFPITSPRRIDTLRTIAADCGATVVLAGAPEQTRQALLAAAPELGALRWVGTDATDDTGFEPVFPTGADVSFLQYTSGSTSAPKGVVVTHDALMHNQELMCHSMGYRPESSIVGWLPLFHDMGLMGLIVPAIYAGGSTVLLPPLTFVQRPERWLRAVTRYSATITGGPNFAFELCCRRIPAAEREGLDLSSLEVMFNGAEPIRDETLAKFAREFGPHGFDPRSHYPCYGLAESTLFTAGAVRGAGAVTLSVDRAQLAEGRVVAGAGHTLVSSGVVASHRELLIVDPETRTPVAEGDVGEIWIGGPDVAAGYWQNADATTETFRAETVSPRRGPLLRSGDLGAVVDGELYVVGRRKDLIIVGGRNYYPQDIEATVENASPLVRRGCTAAFASDRAGGEELIVVAETRADATGIDVAALSAALRAAITIDHSITPADVLLVPAGTVPKTSSGKLQRRGTRAAFEAGELALAQQSLTVGAQ